MALAPNALFRDTMTMLEPPQNRLAPSQIWPMENPVGTEQVRPQYLTAPDADVVPGVMWGDRMVSPRVAGGLNSALEIGMGFAGSTGPGGIKAYHGSPHSFDRFDTTKIGTGEGAQAYGHGLYFAEREGTAQGYRDQLAGKGGIFEWNGQPVPPGQPAFELVDSLANQDWRLGKMAEQAAKYGPRSAIDTFEPHTRNKSDGAEWQAAMEKFKQGSGKSAIGHMYEVNIAANPENFLHWDKPLSEQSPFVRERIADIVRLQKVPLKSNVGAETTAGGMMEYLENRLGKVDASIEFSSSGIPGIRYLDQGSRGAPKLTEADKAQLQAAIADTQRMIADPRHHRDVAMLQADLDLFQRRLSGAENVSHNLVVFDDATIEILRKYGLAGLMLGGGAAAGTQGQ